jgi:hypothetical protein
MRPDRKLTRRSFVRRVLGGSIAAGGALALIGGEARAQVTDSDPSDPAGQGRGGGVTDSDSGPGADPAGRGRGGGRPIGDNDPTDRAGYARNPDRRQYNDISGTWLGSNGITYNFVQTGDHFTWELDSGERGLGQVTGLFNATARWSGPYGDGEAQAEFETDSRNNYVTAIRWSNGVVLTRP